MPSTIDTGPALAAIDAKRVLDLEQRSIRIPSSTFEEGNIADLYADYMSDIGLEVEMQQVTHPFDPKLKSRQPIGRLKGTGGGPTLLINGHMDPGVEMSGWTVDPYSAKFEDGWIWGMGAHDDKGGCVAAVCALEAIVRSGTQLKGDVLMTPVIAHKLGGAGTRALLRHGVKADLCINMEHSNNTIANVCVGVVMVRLVCSAPELFFRYSPEARAAYINPIEQQMEIVRRIGPSLTPIAPSGWMTFTPHPELPGFPTHTFDIIHKEHYYFKSATGRSNSRMRADPAVPYRSRADGCHRRERPQAAAGTHQAGSSGVELRARGPRTRHRANLEPARDGLPFGSPSRRRAGRRPSFGLGAAGCRRSQWAPRQRR